MVVIRPSHALDEELPVCVALHGRGSDARMIVQLGVEKLLNTAATPFAMVGLDGGDSYWVAKNPGDDPQRMLTDELPGWLAERHLAPTPFAVFGLSMGAYGALNYARRTPHPVVATLSPALFRDWPDARSRDAFANEARWAATDPLQHADSLGDAALGIWCGTEDPFQPAARELADVTKPQVTKFAPGGHDADYWLRTMPEIVTFLGEHRA
jgi:S-formylglutathione hydrolase FrmB